MMNLTLREVFDRYGPTLAVIVALAALVALMPAADVVTGGQERATGVAAGRRAGDRATDDVDATATGVEGASASASSGPIEVTETFTSVKGAASAWGPEHGPGNYPAPGATPCREDGAMPAFSLYSPQCVPKFSGNNGGATATGVTKDDVLVVWYRPQEDAATSAALSAMGGYDQPEVVERAVKALMRYYNLHSETYGREVKLKIFDGTGAYDDPEVARADAVTIATQLKPFAVVEVNMAALPEFTTELAARKVICLCTTSHSREFYREHSPYLYTVLPVIEEYYEAIAEYWGKRLAGKPAKYAGRNVRVSNDVRKFGLVYIEGVGDVVDPQWKRAAQHFESELRKYGVTLTKSVSYTYDVQQQQQQTTNIIGQMVASGVNVITCVCDGLYPVFLTSEATRQGYFPEWFISGTNLIDTTFFGRTYDAQQWKNAYGISPLWVFAARKENGSGYRAYHHVAQGDESKGIDTYQASIQAVFAGIHYAGPKLTVQNWSQGLFLAPARGGRVNAPLVKFTERDPGAIKDWVEVWWDSNSTGTDELNNSGKGILVKSNKGVRYTNGKWPQVGPYAFADDPAPTFRTNEKATFDHDADGHTHKASERCRSCA